MLDKHILKMDFMDKRTHCISSLVPSTLYTTHGLLTANESSWNVLRFEDSFGDSSFKSYVSTELNNYSENDDLADHNHDLSVLLNMDNPCKPV